MKTMLVHTADKSYTSS